MASLKNQKHEAFAQLTLQGARYGWSQAEIYQRSGFKARGHSAAMAASRLMKNDDIRARIAELGQPAVKKAQVTVESLLAELDEVLSGALDTKQFAAARAAIDSKARLKGLFIDKVEIGHAGEFASLNTPEEVVDALLADMSDPQGVLDLLDTMRRLVEARAAREATNITPTVATRVSNEASAALALSRPGRRTARPKCETGARQS